MLRMNKISLKNLVALLIIGGATGLFIPPQAQATEMTLHTYYPAPYGDYSILRLPSRTSDLNEPCEVGTFYTNTSDELQVCRDIAGVGTWGPLVDIWSQNGDDIILTENDVNPDLTIGFGTATPEFKLTGKDSRTGILAKGTFGSGEILPSLPAGPKFFWYPRKAALRAGYTSGSHWDDGNIGIYSYGFGYYDNPSVTPQGDYSFIGGGKNNLAPGQFSFVGGGELNAAIGSHSAVFSGRGNEVYGDYSIIMGGFFNQNIGNYSFLGGGRFNLLQGDYGTLVGGGENFIESRSPYSVILGGKGNRIDNSTCFACAGAGCTYVPLGEITCDLGTSVIVGGYQNKVSHNFSSIIGGYRNEITGQYSNIVGGYNNTITGHCSAIVGGYMNFCNSTSSVITGGASNSAGGQNQTITGGQGNWITSNSTNGTISGGLTNSISNSSNATVSGGQANQISNADNAWIPAGANMQISGGARSFLWGYSGSPNVSSTIPDRFIIHGSKVGFRDITPAATLEINATALGAFTKILAVTSTQAATSGDVFVINSSNQIGVGQPSPAAGNAMEFGNANGAKLTTGGVWQDAASSINYKENISYLSLNQAYETLKNLDPVVFSYQKTPEDRQLGFIAEDVPELVASKNRDALSSVDILAVLSTIIKDQDTIIDRQQKEIEDIQKKIEVLKQRQK